MSPIRVMVVDDSIVARGLYKRWIEASPGLEIVAMAHNGRHAIDQIEKAAPDVAVLDVEMPGIDGISALPILLRKKPNLAVIIASSLTRRNAEIALKAMSLGALDCIPKPDAATPATASVFQLELINKIKQIGLRARRSEIRLRSLPMVNRSGGEVAAVSGPAAAPTVPASKAVQTIRPLMRMPPRVLVIGASTGGPQALTHIIGSLDGMLQRAPVLITQHMPPTFTTILAEHLSRVCGHRVREAEDGEPIVSGRVYLAPGGLHMRAARRDGLPVIALDDGPHVHFCKPAVDPLFSAAVDVWGGSVLGLILTGMGSDGTKGAGDIIEAGGAVIAQDEATSVVWGMPGSVVEAGLCSAVLPLGEIAPSIAKLFSR